MNVIVLQGGLGNQMFQYALGRRFEEEGIPVMFDRTRVYTYYSGQHDRSRPAYGLDDFETRLEFIRPVNYNHFKTYGTDQIKFEPKVLEMNDTVIAGYWQSEKYFPKTYEVLVQDFFPRGHMPANAVKFSRDIRWGNSIGLQVRRGDYVQFKDFHGVLGKDYFDEGLKLCGPGNVFIWTDDVEWCEENFPEATIANTGFRAWDIFLMSSCARMVISNSSFGWWGAWLGDYYHNKDLFGHRVIAPKQWFATDKIDSSDIVPERWWKI